MTLAFPAAPVPDLPSAPSISTVPIAADCSPEVLQSGLPPGPIASEQRSLLDSLVTSVRGPFGAAVRFRVVAATEQDAEALRGLGTYGFIKGARAFVVGAVGPGEKQLEDYGYAMERVVLGATAIGLGTCWLGGSFTRSRFARAMAPPRPRPSPPSLPSATPRPAARTDGIRRRVSGHRRKPWSELFFDGDFGAALTPERAGPLATAVETLRLAPSASNKQPWRVVRQGSAWHFYLERTPGYGPGTLTSWLLRLANLQRVDMGIAMCHFALAAREAGQVGRWVVQPPTLERPGAAREYVVTWVEGRFTVRDA